MDVTVEPVKKRRRSSILNRQAQDKGPPVGVEGSENKEYVFKITPCDSSSAEDELTLKGYINDLEAEKASWKTILKERKVLKESAKSCTTPELSWNTAHNFLTDEDIKFLKDEPRFEEIAEDFDKLVKCVAISRAKYERVCRLAAVTAGLAQVRVNNIKHNIAEYNEQIVEVSELCV